MPFLREAMSRAWPEWQADKESLLSFGRMTGRTYTANAAAASRRSLRACRHGKRCIWPEWPAGTAVTVVSNN